MKKTTLEQWILKKIGVNYDHSEEKGYLRKCIEIYQFDKLKENIEYVKSKSIFYNKKLEKVDSKYINSFKDFEKVPFTTSKELRDNPLKFLCMSQSSISRIVSINTSGTSGIPKRVFFTREDQELTIDFFNYGMRNIVNKESRVLILIPGKNLGSVGNLLKRALDIIDIYSYIPDTIDDMAILGEIIEKEKIDCIVGMPIQVLLFKRKYEKIFSSNIKRILLSTDYVPNTIIHELSSECCKVFTHYGMTEMGFGGGVECEALNGYHMREADIYFEIIDLKTGERVEDGNYGEIVFSTLTRKGMPLIRYRTGDIGRFFKEPCICGTVLKTMERISGRIENRVKILENDYLEMKDLDEVLLKRKEIFDYNVEITDDEKKLGFYDIIIKFQTSMKTSNMFRDNIINDLYTTIPAIHKGVKKGIIKIILKIDDEPIRIGNGTIKRKILDRRKEINNAGYL